MSIDANKIDNPAVAAKSWFTPAVKRNVGIAATLIAGGGAAAIAKCAGDISQTGLIGLAVAAGVIGLAGIALFVSSFFGQKKEVISPEKQFTLIPAPVQTEASLPPQVSAPTAPVSTPKPAVTIGIEADQEAIEKPVKLETPSLIDDDQKAIEAPSPIVPKAQPNSPASSDVQPAKSTASAQQATPKKARHRRTFNYPEKTNWDKTRDFMSAHPFMTAAAAIGGAAALALGGYYLLPSAVAATTTTTAAGASTALVSTTLPTCAAVETCAAVAGSQLAISAPISSALVTTSTALVPASTALAATSKALVATKAATQLALGAPVAKLMLNAPEVAKVAQNMHGLGSQGINQTPIATPEVPTFSIPAPKVMQSTHQPAANHINQTPPVQPKTNAAQASGGSGYMSTLTTAFSIGLTLLSLIGLNPVGYTGPKLKLD